MHLHLYILSHLSLTAPHTGFWYMKTHRHHRNNSSQLTMNV